MKRLTLLAAVGWLLTSCGGLYVEAEEPQVCKTMAGPSIPGNPTGLSVTYEQQFKYDFGNELLNFGDKKVDTQAQILSVTLTGKNVSDLSFIQSGQVQLLDPNGTKPPIKVLSYQQDPNAPKSVTLVIANGDKVDVTDYLSNGAVDVDLSLTGNLPPQSWSFDIQTCVWVKVHYNYL